MGPINIGARVVKGLTEKIVDDFLASNETKIPSFMSIGTTVIELCEFNNAMKK